MSVELETHFDPCPFCGSDKIEFDDPDAYEEGENGIFCHGCDLVVSMRGPRGLLWNAWNRRVSR